MRLVVIGGGWFGTYHARQLLKACLEPPVVLTVVDRDRACLAFDSLGGRVECVTADWLRFLRDWLPAADPGDRLVPAPLAPHLLWQWLAEEVGASRVAAPHGWRLPYEVSGPEGEVFISAAAWTCPATCVEPAHCPVLHGPRDWDLGDMVEDRAREDGMVPCVFRCLHFAQGVGAIRVGDLQDAAALARQSKGRSLLIATTSRCHAAVGALALAGVGAER